MRRKKTQLVIILAALLCMLVVILPCGKSVQAAEDKGVKIDKEHFPDDTLREMVKERCDWDEDGYLSESECDIITDLYINWDITSFKGIEYLHLSSFTYNYNEKSSYSHLKLNLSSYIGLGSIYIYGKGASSVESIDVKNNSYLRKMCCWGTGNLKKVNLKGCKRLETLEITDSNISELDVSSFCDLKKLDISGTKIKKLDVSKNDKLTNITYDDTTEIVGFKKTITKEKGTKISGKNFKDYRLRKELEGYDTNGDGVLSDNEISSIWSLTIKWDISSFDGIEYLTELRELDYSPQCAQSNYSDLKLDLRKNKKLETLDLSTSTYNSGLKAIRSINLKGLKNLWSLSIGKCTNLKYLNMDGCVNLKDIHIYGAPQLTSIDVSHFTKLTDLYLDANIKTVDVRKAKKLKWLAVRSNCLNTIKIGTKDKLTYCEINGKNLKEINLDGCKNLVYLYLTNTGITKVDTSKMTKLRTLNVSGSKLTKLNVSKNKTLQKLRLDRTNIKTIDVSKNVNLKTVYARKSGLKKLDVSKNRKLKELYVDGSKLKEVDVRKNAALWNVSYDDTMKLKGLSDDVYRSYWKADLSEKQLNRLKKLKKQGEKIFIN